MGYESPLLHREKDDSGCTCVDTKAEVAEYVIGGMKCVSCARKIEKKLRNLDGVVRAEVNPSTTMAKVVHHPETASTKTLEAAITELGFKATPLPSTCDGGGCMVFRVADLRDADEHIVKRLRKALRALKGVVDVDVDQTSRTVRVEVDRVVSSKRVEETIRDTAQLSATRLKNGKYDQVRRSMLHEDEIREHGKALLVAAVFAVPLVGYHMVLGSFAGHHPLRNVPIRRHLTLEPVVEAAVSGFVVFWCGQEFFRSAFNALRGRTANMAVLVVVGVTTAYVVSVVSSVVAALWDYTPELHFATAASLITFMLLGQYLEARAKARTSTALVKLMDLQPTEAVVLEMEGGEVVGEETVEVDDLVKGAVCKVSAGDKVPCDGKVVEGSGSADESMVTGESLPAEKEIGDEVVGGTLVKDGLMHVEVTRVGSGCMLSQILELVTDAQNSKAPIQKYADTISAVFVPTIVGYSLLVLVVWVVLGAVNAYPEEWRGGSTYLVFALQFFIATIIIACPCAMGLATPTAVMVGTGLGATHGVLIKGGEALETASKVDAVLFDKTGTLTKGEVVVTDVDWLADEGSEKQREVLLAVGSAESSSTHPIAQAVVQYVKDEVGGDVSEVSNAETVAGKGIRCEVRGRRVVVGNPAFIVDEIGEGASGVEEQVHRLQDQGKTAVVAGVDGTVVCVMGLSDTIRREAHEVVRWLGENGIEVYMVTGDNQHAATHIAEGLGIERERVFAEVLPGGKAHVVQQLRDEGHRVAFVGDGINDTPALAKADVGIAVGGGTEVAVDAADVVLVRDSLWGVPQCIDLSIATQRRIKWNFLWAFGYNLAALPVASGVLFPLIKVQMPPVVAGIAMMCSSLTVLLSSLLLKFHSVTPTTTYEHIE